VVRLAWVSPDFFTTLGVPVLEGRTFTNAEAMDSTSRQVVISRAAALRLFGSVDAVGRVMTGAWLNKDERIVIGVVDDVRLQLRDNVELMVYEPLAADPFNGFELIVRTTAAKSAVESDISRIMASIDPDMPFTSVDPLSEGVRKAMAEERFFGRVTTLIALIAAVLAAVGLYGLLAYAVAQRTREIGIRLALGARRSVIVASVTVQTVGLALVGILIGTLGGGMLGGVLQNRLYGVEPLDIATNIAAAAILFAVALVSTALPARAAAAVHPATALRTD
jgi:putative ABC transport system permease protein